MNTLLIRTAAAAATLATSAATLLALAATPAAAQEATYEYPQPTVVAKSRAEVQAEVAAARADGTLFVSEAGYSFGDSRSSTARRTAAAAVAEALPKAGLAPHVRSDLNTTNAEPHSFDGVFTAAGAAVNPLRFN